MITLSKNKLRTYLLIFLVVVYLITAALTVYGALRPIYISPMFFPSQEPIKEPSYNKLA